MNAVTPTSAQCLHAHTQVWFASEDFLLARKVYSLAENNPAFEEEAMRLARQGFEHLVKAAAVFGCRLEPTQAERPLDIAWREIHALGGAPDATPPEYNEAVDAALAVIEQLGGRDTVGAGDKHFDAIANFHGVEAAPEQERVAA